MDTSAVWVERQYFPVFADRQVVVPLTLVGFPRGLMPPNLRRRDLRKFPHRQVGKVSEKSARMVKDLWIVRIKPVQFQGNFNRLAVALQAGVGSFELEARHAFQCRVGGPVKPFFQTGQRLTVAAKL